jgi:hypothetical protein
MFGLIHVDPRQGTAAMFLGLILHYSYVVSRSLWVPVLLHTLNNGLAVTMARFDTGKALETAPDTLPVLAYAAAGVLLLAVGWAMYQGRARLVSVIEDGPAWRPVYPGVELPPPDSGTVVRTPWPGALALLAVAAAFAALVGVLYRAASITPPA